MLGRRTLALDKFWKVLICQNPVQGNRQVFWRHFTEEGWWIKVVLLYESHATVILSAYEDTTRGQRRWQASLLR